MEQDFINTVPIFWYTSCIDIRYFGISKVLNIIP